MRWFFLALAFACGIALPALGQQVANRWGPTTSPTGSTSLTGDAPSSIAGSATWTSICYAASAARAYSTFAALAAASTLSTQRYADANCTYPIGAAVPSSPLTLTQGGGCPGSTFCGTVASNDGIPFVALKVSVVNSTGAPNAVTNITLLQAAE